MSNSCGFEIIIPADSLVISICQNCQNLRFTRHRLSDFVISVKIENNVLLFSCLTGELILVTDFYIAFDYLIRHKFIVGIKENEKKNVQQLQKLVHTLKHQKQPHSYTFEIITTTFCNAHCYYCYEKEYKKGKLSEKIAIDIADYISNFNSKIKGNSQIKLRWFGGEPLMNTTPIKIISQKLKSKNITFSSSIITNGYLFDEHIISQINAWNLTDVTITIDGTEKSYNEIKLIDSGNTNAYKKVISNIKKLLFTGIHVIIRMNVGENNLEDIHKLSYELRAIFANTENISFIYRPILNRLADNTIEPGKSNCIYPFIMSEMKLMFDYGYNVTEKLPSGLTGNCCMADSGNFYLIDTNGNILYCSANLNWKSKSSIYSKRNVRPPHLSDYQFEKQSLCQDCPRYINCIPTKKCPAFKNTICNKYQKEYMLYRLKLSMLQEYNNFKHGKK